MDISLAGLLLLSIHLLHMVLKNRNTNKCEERHAQKQLELQLVHELNIHVYKIKNLVKVSSPKIALQVQAGLIGQC